MTHSFIIVNPNILTYIFCFILSSIALKCFAVCLMDGEQGSRGGTHLSTEVIKDHLVLAVVPHLRRLHLVPLADLPLQLRVGALQ